MTWDESQHPRDEQGRFGAGGGSEGGGESSGRRDSGGGTSNIPVVAAEGDEATALSDYVHTFSVNSSLREGRANLDSYRVRGMDSLIARTPPIEQPMSFWRGITERFAQENMQPGTTYTDPAYVSAGKSPSDAFSKALTLSGAESMTQFRVDVPAGSHVVDVDAVKEATTEWIGSGRTNEVVLPRDSTFDIVKDGNQLVMKLK